jgi:hypothetical protein
MFGQSQVITQYLNITGAQVSQLYSAFLQRLAFVNFDVGWLLPTGCYVEIDFYDKLLLTTLAPLGLTAIVMTPRIFAYIFKGYSRQLSSTSITRLGIGTTRDIRLLLVFSFWLFSSVSTTVLQTFACEQFSTGEWFLRSDYAVQCDTSKHKLYQIYAAIMTLVYPIGIPALYLIVLWKERRLAREAQHASVSYAPFSDQTATSNFLWEPYRLKVYYWECIECVRRLLLTGLSAFVLPSTAGQSAVACTLAFFTILVYGFVHPHVKRADTVEYTLGAAIVFVTMFASLLTQAKYTDSASEHVISILLIGLNVALACMALVEGAIAAKSESLTKALAPAFERGGNA